MFTSPVQVAGIIEVDEGDDVNPFIEVAGQLVSDVCTSSGYSDDKLELIERWLSAHFYDVMRPRTAVEAVTGAVGVNQRFEDIKVDLGLSVTKYGQQAMIIDTAGNLASLNNLLKKITNRKKRLYWLGTHYPAICQCRPEWF